MMDTKHVISFAWSRMLSLNMPLLCFFFFFSGAASAPDFESAAYGSVLYFLEAVLPFLEAFYRDFYFPDQAAHGNEIDETDHIAKAVTVSLLSIKRNTF